MAGPTVYFPGVPEDTVAAGELTQQVRKILDRASYGTEPHGLRFQLLSFDRGVARVRLLRTEPGHTCSECDVTVPIVLNYLMQDLRDVKGLRDVQLV
jgi:hypothetical protein